jgi:hypothetical protein
MVAGTPERYPAATAKVNILDAEELLAALAEFVQVAGGAEAALLRLADYHDWPRTPTAAESLQERLRQAEQERDAARRERDMRIPPMHGVSWSDPVAERDAAVQKAEREANAAKWWEHRYRMQHNTVHGLEDELAAAVQVAERAQAALREIANAKCFAGSSLYGSQDTVAVARAALDKDEPA